MRIYDAPQQLAAGCFHVTVIRLWRAKQRFSDGRRRWKKNRE